MNLLLHLGIHLIQVALVVLGDQHGGDALAEGSHALFLQAADGQHIAVQRDLTGHGQIVVHGDAGQRRDQCRGQRNAGRGAVLGNSALRGVDVQVSVFEFIRRDAVFLGMDAGVGHGQLGALLHDITQTAGDFDLAGAARDDSHLHGQHLTPNAGPGQTIGDADSILAGDKGRLDLFGAEQRLDRGGGDADLFLLPGGDLLGAFAQHRCDGALKIAHTGLAGVAVNDGVQCAGRQGHAAVKAVVFQLLGQQVALGNVELLGAGIAGQLDHIHTVIEGAGDGRGIVGRCDKQHLAQIERDIQIVVLEGAVLLGVQHLKQCAGGVALVIACQLVDLVQQNDRVCGLGRCNGADDAPGHGTDIGAAVAADLSLIMDAAQTHAGELSVHALGDGMCDTRLADTRRADKADDLSLDILIQLAHGQQLQNTLLDLLQAVMLTVQHLAGMGLIKVILGRGMPRQGKAGVQIAADHTALGAAALHTGQTVTLLEQLLGGFLIQRQRPDLLAVCIGLGAGILGITQLLADNVHLLTQVVFPLALVHLGIDLVVQIALDLKDLTLLTQQGQQLFQTAQQRGLVQNDLLVLILEQQIGGHILAEVERRIRRDNVIDNILGDLRAVGEVLLKAVLQAADQCLDLRALIGGNAAHRHRAHRGLQVFILAVQLQQARAGLALDQHLYEILGDAQYLLDLRNHAVAIQVPQCRLLDIHLALGHKEYAAVIVHGSLDRCDGLGAAHLKMDHIVGEHHQPAQGDGRKMHHIAGDLDFDFFRHCLLSHSLQNRRLVCIGGQLGRQQNVRRTAHRFRMHLHLGRAFAIQCCDERVAVQHLYINLACAEKGHVGLEFFRHGIILQQMLPFFVSTQQPGQLQARHRLEKDNIQQTVRHAGVGRGTVAAAVLLAVADRQHHVDILHLPVICRDAQPMAEGAAHRLKDRQCVGRGASAQRHPSPLGDAVGHLRVNARSVDVNAAALRRADHIHRKGARRQLGIQIKELRLCTEVAHIIVTAAAGDAAHRRIVIAGSPLQNLVQRTVAAAGIEENLLPGGRIFCGKVPRLPGAAGHLNGGAHTGAAGGSMDLGDQRHTGIYLARRRIYDKDMLHWPVPFSMDSLRSIDSYYCIFFKAKVQYPAAK